MKPVFADTVYYLALTNPRDQYASAAARYGRLRGHVCHDRLGVSGGCQLVDARPRPRVVLRTVRGSGQ